jgi:hypothetical protein
MNAACGMFTLPMDFIRFLPSFCVSGNRGYPISDDRTNKSLTIPSPPGNFFFRLLHP